MSNYESDPAGLGVGKRYGTLDLGGMSGKVGTYGNDEEAIFEISAEESAVPLSIKLPSEALVTGAYLEVEEVFAATSGVTFQIGSGGTPITTEGNLTVLGLSTLATTGLSPDDTNGVGALGEDLIATLDAAALASATGFARLRVDYTRI
jgi:hypothetical protein